VLTYYKVQTLFVFFYSQKKTFYIDAVNFHNLNWC